MKVRKSMITSRLTSKAQTTIPQAARTTLGLREGAAIADEIVDRRAVITRASPHSPDDDPFGARPPAGACYRGKG